MNSSISQETYQSLFELANDAMLVIRAPNCQIIAANRAMSLMTGYCQAELVQLPFEQLISPEMRQDTLDFLSCDDTPQSGHEEVMWLHKGGESFMVAIGFAPIETSQGTIWQVTARNIQTDRQRDEEAWIRASIFETLTQRPSHEALAKALRALSQRLPISVAGLLFWTPEQEKFTRGSQWIHPEYEQEIRSMFQEIYGNESGQDLSIHQDSYWDHFLRTGEALYVPDTRENHYWGDNVRVRYGIYCSLVLPLIQRKDLKAIIIIQSPQVDAFSTKDRQLIERFLPAFISTAEAWYAEVQLQRVNNQLSAQVQRLRYVVDHLPYGFILLDLDQQITEVNLLAQDYLTTLLEYELGDALIELGDIPIQQMLNTRPGETTWHKIVSRDGTRSFMAVAFTISQGDDPANDKVHEYMVLVRDVTKEIEEQEHAETQKRLATIGQVTTGIAHDFNNIMAVIMLNCQLLGKNPDLLKRTQYLQTIQRQARQAANLIGQVQDFSRQSMMKSTTVNVVHFLQALIELLKRTLPENISIHLHRSIDEVYAKVDESHLQKVFLNLAANASDAMPDGGQLTLHLTWFTVDSDHVAPVPTMKPGKWFSIAHEDSGYGMAEKTLQKVFQPFFTTKPPGSGTGLGLAQAYGIIKQFDGEITVKSQPNKGTVFTIYLPAISTTTHSIS